MSKTFGNDWSILLEVDEEFIEEEISIPNKENVD